MALRQSARCGAGECWRLIFLPLRWAWVMRGSSSTKIVSAGTTGSRIPIWHLESRFQDLKVLRTALGSRGELLLRCHETFQRRGRRPEDRAKDASETRGHSDMA